jgi:DNA polymerase-1
MSENQKRLVIIDAHAILHRAYHALPEFSNSKGEPTGALYGLSAMLIKIISDLKPDYIVAAYDLPKPTFRHEVYKEYKEGRAKAEPDLISQMIRSRAVFEAFGIPIYDKEGFEADDIIGTIVCKIRNSNFEIRNYDINIIIASGDMDALQLVNDKKVQVYTLKKGINDTILYDEEKVEERFGFPPSLLPDYKGLAGDPSDNIKGVKGIGEKTATELIKTFGAIEDIYKNLEKVKPRTAELLKKDEKDAVLSKMLATIRPDAPIKFVLPEKSWKDGLDIKVAGKLFQELEFRVLGERLKNVVEVTPTTPPRGLGTPPQAGGDLEVREECIALWLINSNLTNPSREDVLNFAHTNNAGEARGRATWGG